MGIEALTHRDDGLPGLPATEKEWSDWISATQTRNFILGDPVLDWLDLFGESHGFRKDTEYEGFDSRTDFTNFVFEQGRRFELAVLALIKRSYEVVTVATRPGDARDLSKAETTFESMRSGIPIVHQGVLLDPEHKTYGLPDLLIRSDILRELFPASITLDESGVVAPEIPGAAWHYRVVDIKFRTVGLLAGGELNNSGSAPAYKIQLYTYNQALGRIQGLEPPTSYLLGRGWTQGNNRGFSCLERLAPVPQSGTVAGGRLIFDVVAESENWIKKLRLEGSTWEVLPQPSVSELYPDSGNTEDGPWHHAKRELSEGLEDLTMLWQVGIPGRKKGHDAGVYRWTDLRVTPELVGVTGEKNQPVLEKLLDVQRDMQGGPVRPSVIQTARDEWHDVPDLEFYVDFETVTDLADDFSRLPERGGQPLIFMIGCGHVEDGEWKFQSFVVDTLSEVDEARIIGAWLEHMESAKNRLASNANQPLVIHWSPAEVSNFETAYNSAKERHNRPEWPTPGWFDFLRRVVHGEPVVTRGALGFGLKAIAKAMHSHGLVETLWDDGPADGLGAMVGAWWCNEEAIRLRVGMSEIALMQEIVRYNEVDCKVMMEIVRYLRENH